MVAQDIMHMNAGDGKTSYAKNSGLQRVVISKTLPMLTVALKNMLEDPHFRSKKCYKLVDLGCASGSNSLWAMTQIVNTIVNISREKNVDDVPEFEVYLNDLPGNDFNNLFKLLPSLHGDHNEKEKGRCFVYGLPGSFYERLFTEKTLHFAYSSYSLHWLSQVPEGLESSNKENIYLAANSSPKVVEAYSNQFQKDFSTFLMLRAKEMIRGGRMVLSFVGRSFENPYIYDDSAHATLLAKTFREMVIEGLVKREDLYSFNMPHYAPCKSEVKSIVEKEGSFTSERIEDFRVPWDANSSINDEQEDELIDIHKRAKLVARSIRAFMEPMITKHFGSSINIDDLFERYEKKVADHMSMNKSTYFTIVISLSRK